MRREVWSDVSRGDVGSSDAGRSLDSWFGDVEHAVRGRLDESLTWRRTRRVGNGDGGRRGDAGDRREHRAVFVAVVESVVDARNQTGETLGGAGTECLMGGALLLEIVSERECHQDQTAMILALGSWQVRQARFNERGQSRQLRRVRGRLNAIGNAADLNLRYGASRGCHGGLRKPPYTPK